MKTQIAYKVLEQKTASQFDSIDGFRNKLSLVYHMNEETKPVIGKIFCFDSLENAENFQEKMGGIVFKGIGTNPSKIKFACDNKENFTKFWKLKNKKVKNTFGTLPIPKGTVLVDSFTPTEILS